MGKKYVNYWMGARDDDKAFEQDMDLEEWFKSICDKNGLHYEEHNNGIYIINNRYYYATTTCRWTVKGRERKSWYYSKGLEDFIERFVKK